MKFKLLVRQVEISDLSIQCPFLPENSDYQIALDRILEDIKNRPSCKSAELEGNTIFVDSSLESDAELKKDLKDTFSEHFCFVRYAGVEKL